jgi:hypothetical protein
LTDLMKAVVPASYVAATVLFAAGVVLTVIGQLWVFALGGLSSVGLASICVLYVLSEHRFEGLGVRPVQSVVLALLFANAFLQSYEIIYGLTFFPPLTGAEARTVVLWLLMVSPLVLVSQYLRVRWTSAVILFAFGAVWAVWLLYGFPQYYFSGYPYPQVLKAGDTFHLSLWFNFGSKALLAAFYASLLDPVRSLRDLLNWKYIKA